MKKYSKYCIVKTLDVITLEEEVNELLSDGWSIYGNIVVVTDETSNMRMLLYFQAMIK